MYDVCRYREHERTTVELLKGLKYEVDVALFELNFEHQNLFDHGFRF